MTLTHTMAAIPGGNTRRTYGTAFWDGSKWYANMNGNLLDARWLDPIQPIQGGKIVVDITKDDYGLSTALVVGGYTDQPRPSTGIAQSVIPAGLSTQIVFIGEDGVEYTTDRFIGTYSPGDPVYITWDAAVPTIIGKIQTVAVAPEAPAPPPPATVKSGEVPVIATASDTWGVGGWGRWATSQFGGEDVYTGFRYGYTLTGAWFYGAPKPELQGKTITRIRFRVPPRLDAGNHNDPATIHFYAHTSGSRPGGDVNRVTGPHDIVVAAKSPGGDIDLPLSFAPALVAGGGISIAGDPYAGFSSRLDDPESGKLLINWSS